MEVNPFSGGDTLIHISVSVSLSLDTVKGIQVQTIREVTSKLTLTSHPYIIAECLNRLNQVSRNNYWLEEEPVLKVGADTFLCYGAKWAKRRVRYREDNFFSV